MAAGNNGALRVPQAHGGVLVMPAKGGPSRNPSGLSKEKRELYEALEKRYLPEVTRVLDNILRIATTDDGVPAIMAAKLFFDQVRGPVKARDDDAIASAVQEQLMALIHEARRRRAEQEKAP